LKEAEKQRQQAQAALREAEKQRQQAKLQAQNAQKQQRRAEQETQEAQNQKKNAQQQRERAEKGESQAKLAQQIAEQRKRQAETARKAETFQRQIAEQQRNNARQSERKAITAQAEAEKRRVNAEVLVQSLTTENLFTSGVELEALLSGLKAGKNVKKYGDAVNADNRTKTIATLQQVVYGLKEHNRLEGHSNSVESVVFSPDASTIATRSSDNTVKLWNLNGQELQTWKGHSRPVTSVVFSPDASTIATGSEDTSVKLWNLNGQVLQTWKGHSSPVTSVVFVNKDRSWLQGLTDTQTTFLVEPTRKELDEQLWNQNWDILFFAGHTASIADGEIGEIYINQNESLTISQLKNALKTAITRGLKLAIFNSCDGIGLARNLADLNIPQMIVMREGVPDLVAQEFLKNFFVAFAGGKPFYLAVREARERLQGLENGFPCASWLPVICQNPTFETLTWQEMKNFPSRVPTRRSRLLRTVILGVLITALVIILQLLIPSILLRYEKLLFQAGDIISLECLGNIPGSTLLPKIWV